MAGKRGVYNTRKMRTIHLCGDEPCPNDDQFEHRFYFGCVPKDFSDRTGRSKTHHQIAPTPPDLRYRWNGGCDQRSNTEEGKP